MAGLKKAKKDAVRKKGNVSLEDVLEAQEQQASTTRYQLDTIHEFTKYLKLETGHSLRFKVFKSLLKTVSNAGMLHFADFLKKEWHNLKHFIPNYKHKGEGRVLGKLTYKVLDDYRVEFVAVYSNYLKGERDYLLFIGKITMAMYKDDQLYNKEMSRIIEEGRGHNVALVRIIKKLEVKVEVLEKDKALFDRYVKGVDRLCYILSRVFPADKHTYNLGEWATGSIPIERAGVQHLYIQNILKEMDTENTPLQSSADIKAKMDQL